jgi:hypothetical protein
MILDMRTTPDAITPLESYLFEYANTVYVFIFPWYNLKGKYTYNNSNKSSQFRENEFKESLQRNKNVSSFFYVCVCVRVNRKMENGLIKNKNVVMLA